MDEPALAGSFDLIVVYFGSRSSFACQQCLHVFRRPRATKYQLLADVRFSREWAQLVAARGPWSRLWLPDDDVVASACDVARLFWAMDAAQLQLAQMSVCRVGGTWVFWPTLFQRPGIALRFTPFVEIMAPAFDFSFFQAVVRPTLVHSFTGWGLDTVWPYLLGFPRDRVGVVDAVCMTHNGTAGLGLWAPGDHTRSNYAAAGSAAPYADAWEEERHVVHELWRISRDDLWNAGVPSDPVARFVHEFWNVPLLPGGAAEAALKRKRQPAPQEQLQQPAPHEQQRQPAPHQHQEPAGGDFGQLSAAPTTASHCPACPSYASLAPQQAAAARPLALKDEARLSTKQARLAVWGAAARVGPASGSVATVGLLLAAAALATAFMLSSLVLKRRQVPAK